MTKKINAYPTVSICGAQTNMVSWVFGTLKTDPHLNSLILILTLCKWNVEINSH